MKLEEFDVRKKIAKGAFGDVYLAKYNGEYYALKAVDKHNIYRKNMLKEIVSEKDILSQMSAPFTVKMYYCFQSTNLIYFAMEYCCGGDLAGILVGVGFFDEDEAVYYITQVAVALSSLHHLGIIHRDLKPANILMSGDGTIKLSDFGLSSRSNNYKMSKVCGTPGQLKSFKQQLVLREKLAEKTPALIGKTRTFHPQPIPMRDFASDDEDLTMDDLPSTEATAKSPDRSERHHLDSSTPRSRNQRRLSERQPTTEEYISSKVVGSPDYMSPELVQDHVICKKSDCWSLGVVLYEFLHGIPPFNAGTVDEVFANIVAGEIDWDVVDGSLGDSMVDLLKGLLTFTPNDRLSSNQVISHEVINAHFGTRGTLEETIRKIKETKPPFKPELDGPEDLTYFEE